jgi:hypothetical protein
MCIKRSERSIERTSLGKVRLLPAAAHVKAIGKIHSCQTDSRG